MDYNLYDDSLLLILDAIGSWQSRTFPRKAAIWYSRSSWLVVRQ